MTRIVADDAIPWLSEAFADLGEVVPVPGRSIDRDVLHGADVLLTRSVTRVDASLVQGTGLRLVASATAGIDHVDREALTARGIDFAHAPGCNAQGVVEYVLTELLRLWTERRDVEPGPVGVIGFGQVGSRLVAALQDLRIPVVVNDPPLQARATVQARPWCDLASLIRRCPVVTLHVPRVAGGAWPTPHLLGTDALDSMAPGAVVINTSRGDVVDNRALRAWLDAGRGQAILDVFEGEPRVDPTLLGHRAVRRATPHIAGYTVQGKARATAMIHAAVCEHLDRQPNFHVDDVVPAPVAVEVPPADSDLRWLANLLLLQHDFASIDAQTRALARLEPSASARRFETLRKTYRLRHELSHRLRPPVPAFARRRLPCPLGPVLERLCPDSA